MSKKNKYENRRGRVLGTVIPFLVLGGILSNGIGVVAAVAVAGIAAFGIGKVVGIMSQPLDTTTHNKQDKPRQDMEELAKQSTGNEDADAVITKGKEMLDQIRAENRAIPDQALSQQMDILEDKCVQIFKTVAEQPQKVTQIRKFMNYYLPTTLKMLAAYRTMQDRGVSRSDLMEARNTLLRGLDMINTACQKQLDNLYKGDLLDISTDIDVLEQMLKRDGFADGGLGNIPTETPAQPARTTSVPPMGTQVPDTQSTPIMQNPRTAASAQMGTESRPTLMVDEDGDGVDDFQSYYQKR